MRLILVEWVDSASYSGWHKLSLGTDCVSNCITVGLLCYDDEKHLVISQSRSDTGNTGDTISIPKCCIKRVRTLKVA